MMTINVYLTHVWHEHLVSKKLHDALSALQRLDRGHSIYYPPKKMALITSDCGTTRSPSIKWP